MTDETTDQASEDTTRTDPIDTAEQQAADLAAAEETLGASLNLRDGIDPNSPAPRLSFSPASRPPLDELRDTALRSLYEKVPTTHVCDLDSLAAAIKAVSES